MKEVIEANAAVRDAILAAIEPAFGLYGQHDISRRTGANQAIVWRVLKNWKDFASEPPEVTTGPKTKKGMRAVDLAAWMHHNAKLKGKKEVIEDIKKILDTI